MSGAVVLDRFTLAQIAGLAPLHAAAGGPIEVDVGAGKGRFLLARAKHHPSTSFLGIERQMGRVLRIARQSRRLGLANIRIVRLDALYVIEHLLPQASVATFYLFFPDPWPKRRHHDRRLVCAQFLDAVWRALRPGGCLHVATDDGSYFGEIARCARGDARFRAVVPFIPAPEEATDFELTFAALGRSAHRLSVAKA
jgi:tRNA (guanine-N7-)-methyltransferase